MSGLRIREKDFQALKKQFQITHGRTVPDYKAAEPFILTIDFSGKAVGVTLSQIQNGQEKLIAAAGRKNTPGEQNYASWKGEYMALVYGTGQVRAQILPSLLPRW